MSTYDKLATAAILSEQYEDGLIALYQENLDSTPNPIRFDNETSRIGIRLESGSSIIGKHVRSVWLFFRKFGLPQRDFTVRVRAVSDDSVAVTIGSFGIKHFLGGGTEHTVVIRNRKNTYNCVVGDRILVEFPSNDVNSMDLTANSVDAIQHRMLLPSSMMVVMLYWQILFV